MKADQDPRAETTGEEILRLLRQLEGRLKTPRTRPHQQDGG